MSFRLVPKSVILNDLERRNSQPPRNFTEFGSFLEGHDMELEVFMYVAYLDQANALFLYFVVRIRRRRKKFTFPISSADEFLVNLPSTQSQLAKYTDLIADGQAMLQ